MTRRARRAWTYAFTHALGYAAAFHHFTKASYGDAVFEFAGVVLLQFVFSLWFTVDMWDRWVDSGKEEVRP